jgi:hypothetical protein
MVDAHVSRCAGCSSFAESAAVFTKTLRDAPLERLDRPVVVGRPRRTAALSRFQVGIAAALAIAAVGLAAQLDSGASPSDSPTFGPVTRYPTNAEVRSEIALLGSMRSRASGYESNPSGAIF